METRISASHHQWTIAELQAGLDVGYLKSRIRASLKEVDSRDVKGRLLKPEQVILSETISDESALREKIDAVAAFSFCSFSESLRRRSMFLAPKVQEKPSTEKSQTPHLAEEVNSLAEFTAVIESFEAQELMANNRLKISLYYFLHYAYEKIRYLFQTQEENSILNQELLALTSTLNRLITYLQKGSQTLCLSEHKIYFILYTLMLHIRSNEQDKIKELLASLEDEVTQFLDLFRAAQRKDLIPDEQYLIACIAQFMFIPEVNTYIAKPVTNKSVYELIKQLLNFARPIYTHSAHARFYMQTYKRLDQFKYGINISENLDDRTITAEQFRAYLDTSPPESVGYMKSETILEKLLSLHIKTIQQEVEGPGLRLSDPDVLVRLYIATQKLLEKNLLYYHFYMSLVVLTIEGQKGSSEFIAYSDNFLSNLLSNKSEFDNFCSQLVASPQRDSLRDCSKHISNWKKLAQHFISKNESPLAEKSLFIAERLIPITRSYLMLCSRRKSLTNQEIQDKMGLCRSIYQLQSRINLSAQFFPSSVPTASSSSASPSSAEKELTPTSSISAGMVNIASLPKATEVISTTQLPTTTPVDALIAQSPQDVANMLDREKNLLIREERLRAKEAALAAREVNIHEQEQSFSTKAAAFDASVKEFVREKDDSLEHYTNEKTRLTIFETLVSSTKKELTVDEIALDQDQKNFYAEVQKKIKELSDWEEELDQDQKNFYAHVQMKTKELSDREEKLGQPQKDVYSLPLQSEKVIDSGIAAQATSKDSLQPQRGEAPRISQDPHAFFHAQPATQLETPTISWLSSKRKPEGNQPRRQSTSL